MKRDGGPVKGRGSPTAKLVRAEGKQGGTARNLALANQSNFDWLGRGFSIRHMNINLKRTREAAIRLSGSSEKERNAFLRALSAQLAHRKKSILRANERDVAAAKKSGLAAAFVERLVFDSRALKLLKAKVRSVENLRSRLGEVMEQRTLRKGLVLKKVRVSLGVMLVIYEARPEVTIDVAALCIKSGNAALLKGGSEARRTNEALFTCAPDVLKKTGLWMDTIGFF